MLSTMSPPSPHLPIFNFDFTTATSHKPAHSSPLSSSPIRASQSSPPLSPRDSNALPRRGYFSSPSKSAFGNQEASKWTRFDARDAKKNPLKQSRENALEGKRKLFLKNVRQRHDDKAWERRGGDQEVCYSVCRMMGRSTNKFIRYCDWSGPPRTEKDASKKRETSTVSCSKTIWKTYLNFRNHIRQHTKRMI